MGLIECADCGRAVSDAAPACPGCGRPVQGAPTGEGMFLQAMNALTAVFMIMLGVVATFVLIAWWVR